MRQKYRQKLFKKSNQGPDGQKTTKTKTKGIDNADKKNFPGNFFVRTKGHLLSSKMLPIFMSFLTAKFLSLQYNCKIELNMSFISL